MSVITRMNDEFNCSSIYHGGSTTPDMVDQVMDGPGVSAPVKDKEASDLILDEPDPCIFEEDQATVQCTRMCRTCCYGGS